MRILYAALKHDYGDPGRGPSFEHWNFFDPLHRSGHDVLYFDFRALERRHGRAAMNRKLEEVVRTEKPDLTFVVLFEDELDRRAVRRISDSGLTATVNWFCDDHWRFETFSRRWAPCFQWVVTTARSALPKYQRLGHTGVIKSQWACNTFLYNPGPEATFIHDVSFVGQPHGDRREVVKALRREGIDVACRGHGWPEGRVTQEEMIDVFRRSRVNLNLSNASTSPPGVFERWSSRWRARADAVSRRLGVGATTRPPRRPRIPKEPVVASSVLSRAGDQIKGRNFEVPGCGGLLVTGEADDLAAYYEPGREIVTFRTFGELLESIRSLLRDEERRRSIAAAGLERTLRDHTWGQRFDEIFRRIGLPAQAATASPGIVEEIR